MSASSSLSAKAYQHIQRKLLAGDWVAGDVISELGVAQELGISRTPVREAIRDLEQEGVLEQVPRFGTRVKALERQDLVELYELRDALEPYAVAKVAGRLAAEDIESLRRFCDELKLVADDLQKKKKDKPDATAMKRMLSADMAFHHFLIRAAGNGRLMKIVAEGRVLARIFTTSRQEHNLEVIEQTFRYHTDILDCIISGNGVKAAQLMSDHIRASMQEALDHFDRQMEAAKQQAMTSDLPEVFMNELIEAEKIQPSSKNRRTRSH